MITRQKSFAARTSCFLGRPALFRSHLPADAGIALFGDSMLCEYTPAPARSSAGVEIVVPLAPPQAEVEVVPRAPGYGLVWIPGAWVWEDRWAWVGGHWARPPYRGAVWVRPEYADRNGTHIFVRGGWR